MVDATDSIFDPDDLDELVSDSSFLDPGLMTQLASWIISSGMNGSSSSQSNSSSTSNSPSPEDDGNAKLHKLMVALAGEDETDEFLNSVSIPNVHDEQARRLREAVANKELADKALPVYGLAVSKALNNVITENFHEGKLSVVMKAGYSNIEDGKIGDVEVSGRYGAPREISFSWGYWFFEDGSVSGEKHEFKEYSNPPSYFVSRLAALTLVQLEKAGYETKVVESELRDNRDTAKIEFLVDWSDEHFDRAMREFQYASQIEAFESGVPLEDILA